MIYVLSKNKKNVIFFYLKNIILTAKLINFFPLKYHFAFVSSKIYDKRDHFDLDIANFPFLAEMGPITFESNHYHYHYMAVSSLPLHTFFEM